MRQNDGVIEERLGSLIMAGQRHEVWVRSEPDEDGTWHNALIFRRDGILSPRDATLVGMDWHVPPGIALDRARELGEAEQRELYHRALRPRPPIV